VGNTIQKLVDTTSTPQKHSSELREDVRITNLTTGVCPVISLEDEEQVACICRKGLEGDVCAAQTSLVYELN
jgi:hypothetical protein